MNLVINPAARLSPLESAAREELAALLSAPIVAGDDLRRLPVLCAALGVAVTVERVDWSLGVDEVTRVRRVIGGGS